MYRPGYKEGHCDALSRCDNPQECEYAEQDTYELLKCGPCKKCTKHAQDMVHKDWHKELMASQAPVSEAKNHQEDKMVSRRALEAEPEPSTSSQGNVKKRQQVNILTTWSSTRPFEDLSQQQRNNADIGPILEAKLTGKKPSSQDMVTQSPASSHNWILWDSLAVNDGILSKELVKRDGSGEYLQFVVPSSMKKDTPSDALFSGVLSSGM